MLGVIQILRNAKNKEKNMRMSENIAELAAALSKFQGEIGSLHKSAKAYNYKYTDLASVWDGIREPLERNGLSVYQDTSSDERGCSVTTILMHKSGQIIESSPLLIPMSKRDAQSVGSAATYARRYGILAALGISTTDDDGALAMKHAPEQAQKKIQAVDTQAWIDEMSTKYSNSDVIGYLSAYCAHKKCEMAIAVNESNHDLEKFHKYISQWINKRNEVRE